MSSMLRQHHVKIQDLAHFLRGYDPSKPQSAEDWSKSESSGFSPGMLLFCLERVSAPQGLAFGKRDDAGETYRVRDLCVVVGRDNGRPLVVNITASAFELRFLEVLMLEKARKAILDGKDFLYVAAKPAQPLNDAKIREIEQLGALYSQGGSRRTLVVDSAGPQEPAVALLGALGVKLQIGGIGKQVLDIGSVCHMLYTPEGRQEDRNKTIVKQSFLPIPNTHPVSGDGLTASGVYPAGMPLSSPTASGSSPVAQAPHAPAGYPPSSGAEPVWQEPIPPTVPLKAPHSSDLYSSPPKQEWSPAQQPAWNEPSSQIGPDLRFSFERTEISTDSSTWQQGGQGYSFPGQPPAGSAQAPGVEPHTAVAPPPPQEPRNEAPAPQPELQYQAPATTPPGVPFQAQGEQSETLQHLPGTHLDIQFQMPAPAPEMQYQAPQVPASMQYQSTEPVSQQQPVPEENFADQFKQDLQQGMAGEAAFAHYSGFTDPDGETTSKKAADAEFDKIYPSPQASVVQPFAQPVEPPQKASLEEAFAGINQDESQRLDANLLKDISVMAEQARLSSAQAGTTPAGWGALPESTPPTPAAEPVPFNWQGFTPTGMAAQGSLPPTQEAASSEGDWSAGMSQAPTSMAVPLADPLPPPAEAVPATAEPEGANFSAATAPEPADYADESSKAKPKGKSTLFERLNEQFAKVVPANDEIAPAEPAGVQPATAEPDLETAEPSRSAPTAEFNHAAAAVEGLASEASPQIEEQLPPPATAPAAFPSATSSGANFATANGATPTAANAGAAVSADWQEPYAPTAEPAEAAATISTEDATTFSVEIDFEDSSYKNLAEALSGIMEGGLDTPSLLDDEPLPLVGFPTEPASSTAPASHSGAAATSEPASNGGAAGESDADLLAALTGHLQEASAAEASPAEPQAAFAPVSEPSPTMPTPHHDLEPAQSFTAPNINVEPAQPAAQHIVFEPIQPHSAPTAAEPAQTAGAPEIAHEPVQPAANDSLSSTLHNEDSSQRAQALSSPPPASEPAQPQPEVEITLPSAQSSGDEYNPPSPTVPAAAQSPVTDPAIAAFAPAGEPAPGAASAASPAAPEPAEPAQPVTPLAVSFPEQPSVASPASIDVSAPPPATPSIVDQQPGPAANAAGEPAKPESAVAGSSDEDAEAVSPRAIPETSAAPPESAQPSGTHTSTQEVAIAADEVAAAAALVQQGVFHDSRSVMNEMATLMNKLEQQVAKAGKKLNSRAEEIKQRLNSQVTELVAAAAEIEKNSQSSITNVSNQQSKRLDDVSEEVRLKISDVASNGRYTIKQLLATNQSQVEESKTALYESLRDVCKQFRVDTEALAKSSEENLNRLVTERTEQLQALVNSICTRLEDSNKSFVEKLNARFDRFTERMTEEASSVVRSLERNVRSMTEEIDGSWDRASDKLKSSKGEFEQTIAHTVRTTQLGVSHTTRRMLTEALIPKLHERKLAVRAVSTELHRRFTDDSEGQATGQLLGLESSLGAARQQLQALVEECMSSIDTVGRGQQAGLEEIFKETSTHAEKATAEVTASLQKAESQIRETELACKKLAETSSLDSDPELTDERNTATSRVQQLRQQAMSELTSTIDGGCSNLEQLSHKVHTDLSNCRMEHTQAVREAAENGVTRLRDAIQEALAAIQGARDKYME